MAKLETSKWAFLRVAVAVFDAYAHGATVPALARETARLLVEAEREFHAATGTQNQEQAQISGLLSRAAGELGGMAMNDPFTVRRADCIRDYILTEMERLSR